MRGTGLCFGAMVCVDVGVEAGCWSGHTNVHDNRRGRLVRKCVVRANVIHGEGCCWCGVNEKGVVSALAVERGSLIFSDVRSHNVLLVDVGVRGCHEEYCRVRTTCPPDLSPWPPSLLKYASARNTQRIGASCTTPRVASTGDYHSTSWMRLRRVSRFVRSPPRRASLTLSRLVPSRACQQRRAAACCCTGCDRRTTTQRPDVQSSRGGGSAA